ncbi:hypothetical protein [Burkholderia ubonensis]|nr:hypothetical protein [Burkholderia ubonensis]
MLLVGISAGKFDAEVNEGRATGWAVGLGEIEETHFSMMTFEQKYD